MKTSEYENEHKSEYETTIKVRYENEYKNEYEIEVTYFTANIKLRTILLSYW